MCEVIMMKRAGSKAWVTRLLVYGLLLMVCTRPSWATSVDKLTDKTLVKYAALIIEGKVTHVKSAWNGDHTQIHTVVTISVARIMKGKLPDEKTIMLRLLGGRVDDTVMEVIGGPTFKKDEEVILFLGKNIEVLLPIVGLFQGKITIESDPDTGNKTISRGRMPRGKKVESRDEFVRKIRKLIADQAKQKKGEK